MVERTCPYCQNMFHVIPSRLKYGRGKFCSPKCQYAAKGKKKQVSLVCVGCGENFSKPPSQSNAKYCNRKCRDLHWIGDKTSNWQNGDRVYKRGSHWYSIRRRVLKRDGYICKCCGSESNLHVHYKIPYRILSDKNIVNSDWNLITLCAVCHRKEESRFKWISFENSALCFNSGDEAWSLSRQKGIV